MGKDVRDINGELGEFAITNWTSDLVLNCDSTSDGELADVLATLINMLIQKGVISGSVAS